MTTELQRFYTNYPPEKFSTSDLTHEVKDFIITVYLLASHIGGLKDYLLGIDEEIARTGRFNKGEFDKVWSYSVWVLSLSKPIFDVIHPRKLKEGYLPDDQEVLDFVRKACVRVGDFRGDVLRRWKNQTTEQQLTGESLQTRLCAWLNECVGKRDAEDKDERDARFLEEAIELMQARGRSKEEIHQMVESVYAKPVGQVPQEIAGTLMTLFALAQSHGYDLMGLGEQEYRRITQDNVKKASGRKTRIHFQSTTTV